MILRVFEDFADQSTTILGIIKDCIDNNQEDAIIHETPVYEKLEFELY